MRIFVYWCHYYDCDVEDVVSDYGFVAGKNLNDAASKVAEIYGEDLMTEIRVKVVDCGVSGYLPMKERDLDDAREWWQRMEQA